MPQGNKIAGAVWFAVLLNLKHIYLYIAPAYFVFLLRTYCMTRGSLCTHAQTLTQHQYAASGGLLFGRLIGLGAVVGLVFLASFGPFIYMVEI